MDSIAKNHLKKDIKDYNFICYILINTFLFIGLGCLFFLLRSYLNFSKSIITVSLLLICSLVFLYVKFSSRIFGNYKLFIELVEKNIHPQLILNKYNEVIFYNKAFLNFLEIKEFNSIDQIKKLLANGEQKDFLKFLEEVRKKGSCQGEFLFLLPKSSAQWLHIVIKLLDDGNFLWVFEKSQKDIQLIIERQKELDKSNTNSYLFKNAPIGMAMLDRRGKICATNESFNSLTNQKEIIGNPFINLLDSEEKNSFMNIFKKVSFGESIKSPIEVTFGDSKEHVALIYFSPPIKSKILLCCLDNSEQKKYRLQLVHSQKLRAMGELAGGIAHDFNNLLTAMLGYCDLLLLRHPTNDQSFSDIMQIKQNANRAANLVKQLLAFSRQQTLQPKVTNLANDILEISILLKRLISPNIELKIVNDKNLGFVKVDKGQFEQVIINLVVNARDSMPDGGVVIVKTSNININSSRNDGHEVLNPGQYILIEVIDEGCGITVENKFRIFDPFFSTKKGSGTGLGLATVYGIIKQMGGVIFVDSKKGKGTKFSIYLPKYRDGTKLQLKEKKVAISEDLTGTGTILLVEDETPIRLFSARALRDKGYNVIDVASGDEALSVVSSKGKQIDLLITDVVMPHMDGPDLVKKVLEQINDLEVIFISGYAEDSFRRKLIRLDGMHFLSKPFSLSALANKVKEVMALRKKNLAYSGSTHKSEYRKAMLGM